MSKPSFLERADRCRRLGSGRRSGSWTLRALPAVALFSGLLVASPGARAAERAPGERSADSPAPPPVPAWQAYRDLEGLKSRLWELEAGVAAIDSRTRLLHRLADVNLPGQGLEDQLPEQRVLLEQTIAAVDGHLATVGRGVAEPRLQAKLEATLAGWNQVKRQWRGAATRQRDMIGFRSVMELVQWNLVAVRDNVRDLARQLGVQGLEEASPDRMRPPSGLPPTPEL